MIDEQNQPQDKPVHLNEDQESALRGLVPDFEPAAGEPKKEKAKEPDVNAIAMVSMMYMGSFAILAARLGDHWALTEKEVAMLAEPTVAVIEKYAPGAQMGPEAALIAAAVIVIAPRLMVKPPIEGELDGDKSQHPAPQPE